MTQAIADWYADPSGRHELRYWDGVQWTHHVSSGGRPGIDRPTAPASPAAAATTAGGATGGSKNIRRQAEGAGAVDSGAGPSSAISVDSLFTEQVLVVNQKAKLYEVKAEYTVYDQHGRRIGGVREVGRNLATKMLSSGNQSRTVRLQVVDLAGNVRLMITRPSSAWKSTVNVVRGDGGAVGQVVQKTLGLVGKVRFDLVVGREVVGSINAESWGVWDFSVQDAEGGELARITRTWGGFKERFTSADNYVVQIHRPLEEPLRSLVVAAALAVDTALQQKTGERRSRR
ncbi:phospholipid scramblase-related protein [Isoptericola sp. NPDC056578]|uniref:phospholipid scramblase-related protein n=1 Tax=Isoptericola sp. NPDC056578 TaxID=3345870 RepID=UPI0036C12E33